MYHLEHSNDIKIVEIDIRDITLISRTMSNVLLEISTRGRGVRTLYTSFKFVFTINFNCVEYKSNILSGLVGPCLDAAQVAL